MDHVIATIYYYPDHAEAPVPPWIHRGEDLADLIRTVILMETDIPRFELDSSDYDPEMDPEVAQAIAQAWSNPTLDNLYTALSGLDIGFNYSGPEDWAPPVTL